MSPPLIFFTLYVLGSFIGGILLMLPISTRFEIPPIDALFTAVSALTLTGLSVKNISTDFTTFGKFVMLILIQISGIGFISFYLFISYVLSGRIIDISYRKLFSDVFAITKLSIRHLVFFVVFFMFSLQILGTFALILTDQFKFRFFDAFFHSTSALYHAGLDLTGKSLIPASSIVLIIHGFLILVGSLGAPALFELIFRFLKRRAEYESLSLHTRIVLRTTAICILIQTIVLLILIGSKDILKLVFLSIATRTAGFTPFDFSGFPHSALFIICIFMYIGASPGSAGGGIRTVVFAVLISFVFKELSGRKYVTILKRRVPEPTVSKAVAFASGCFFIIIISFFLLLWADGHRFDPMSLFFEAVSAFATVGFSTGITPKLSEASKLILIITMLTGKIGIINLFYAIYYRGREVEIKYVEEDLRIP